MPDSPPSGELFYFPGGLPGFEDQREFRLSRREGLDPLLFLDAPDGGPSFIGAPVDVVSPGYRLALDETAAGELALEAGVFPAAGGAFLAVVLLTFVPGEPPTANLLGPLVLNPEARLGAQVIQLDSGYGVAHPVRPAGPAGGE
ncbi:MAG: flagellar assembly protein FliW [Bryobacteraceae bacterium]|nr:flagellar assembly protein FliW [Bryobacteraceae bacterium]